MPWQLDHVQLAIPANAEELCDSFYINLLGFHSVEKPPLLAVRGGRWYEREGATLHLGVDTNFIPATKAHPALLVDDYDELTASLERAGFTLVPDDLIPGTVRCYVEDPVGNRIELIKA